MLLEARRSALVVVDLQEKLLPAIADGEAVTRRAGILLEAARTLDVPVLVTEQYPRGLGPTIGPIAAKVPNDAQIISKLSFSAGRNADFVEAVARFGAQGRDQLVVCGTETHVCVLQTIAHLKQRETRHQSAVFLVIDASGSRSETDRQAAVARIAAFGVPCVTTEMVLFEWLEAAGSAEFKQLAKLIK